MCERIRAYRGKIRIVILNKDCSLPFSVVRVLDVI